MSKIANRKIIKNALFLYIRMFFLLLISLYTSREVMNILGIEDYGIYQVIAGFVSLFVFLSFSMSNATQRFLSFEIGRANQNHLKQVFSSSLIIYFFIAIGIVLITETLGLWFLKNKLVIPKTRYSSAILVYQFSIIIIVLQTLQIPFNALIISREKMGFYALLSFIEVILKLSIVYILWISQKDKLILYGILMVITTFIIAFSYFLFCYYYFPESRFYLFYDKKLYKELITYSGWNLFGNIAAIAKGQGINVLLNLFFGPIINAAYGAMSQVQSAVNLFLNNLNLSVSPQIIKSYSTNNTSRYLYLILKGSRLSFLLMSVLIFPVIYHIDFLLSIWLKVVPQYTADFIILSLICLLIESLSGTLMTGIQATGQIKRYQIIVGLILFFNFPASYFLLWTGISANIVFIVSIILSIISLICRLFFLHRLGIFTIYLFIKNVIYQCVISSCLITVVLYCLKKSHDLLDKGYLLGFIELFISFLFSLFIAIVFGLDKTEKSYFFNYIKNRYVRSYENIN